MKDTQHITNMSDTEFLSFLYSERDRENSLSEFHGWNNWALAGAIITAICSGYSVLSKNPSLDVVTVLYNAGFIVAFFLTYHSWATIFRRQRAVDFSKVRMMKEVMPVVKIVFVYICAITSSIMIAILNGCNFVFWLWVSVIVAYTLVLILVLCQKEKVVPSFFGEMMLPWVWVNVAFESIMGCVFSIIGTQSFKLAGRQILSPDFEFAACVATVLILLYVLFKLNFGNKVVRRFDEIIDKYLYAGATKEDTFREISKNRMGYGVLDACHKELQSVEQQTKKCVEEEKELSEIKNYVLAGNRELTKLQEYQGRIDDILNHQQTTLNLSKALVDRMNEIVKVSSLFRDITEIQYVFDANQQCHDKVKAISESVGEVSRLVNEAEKEILTAVNTALKKQLEEKQEELRELQQTQ